MSKEIACLICGEPKSLPWEKCRRCGDNPMEDAESDREERIAAPPAVAPAETPRQPENPDSTEPQEAKPAEIDTLKLQKAKLESIRNAPPPSPWLTVYKVMRPLVGLWLIAVGLLMLLQVLRESR